MSADTIGKTIKLLDSHNGRDKVCRTIQYASKFLTWYLAKHSHVESSKKFKTLEEASSMARKIFRLAKSIAHFQSAATTFSEEKDSVVKVTTVIQQLALAFWLLYDHVIWAGKLGLVKTERMPLYMRRANIFWLVAMLMGIVKGGYLLDQSQRMASSVSNKADFRKRQFEIVVELIRNIFDVPIPLTALNQKVAALIPSGMVGLSGTFTSLIGGYQAWSKIK